MVTQVGCCTYKILAWVLLFYSFQFTSASQPLSAIPAVAELVYLLWPWALTYNLDHWTWPTQCQDEPASQISRSKVNSIQKLLSTKHALTHEDKLLLTDTVVVRSGNCITVKVKGVRERVHTCTVSAAILHDESWRNDCSNGVHAVCSVWQWTCC